MVTRPSTPRIEPIRCRISDEATSDIGPFSIVPEWVLRAPVSDRAVRQFALLARYADRERHEAFPSRQTLANALNASTDSVDRATRELVGIGAVQVERRLNSSGDPTSNLYRLLYVKPHEVGAAVRPRLRPHAATSSRTGAETVAAGVRHRTRTTVTRKRSSEEDLSAERVFDEQFWPAYPKKVGRRAALKAFLKLNPNAALLATMLASLARQSAGWALGDPKFIPHPATWLNGERWLDEDIASGHFAKRASGRTGPAPAGKYDHVMIRDSPEDTQ